MAKTPAKKAPATKPAYKVKALDVLMKQVNSLAPKRNKDSDGWLGDAAHRARKSEHNPDADGSVDAVDITHDPKGGCDAWKIAQAIAATKDRRVKTMIHNRQILTTTGKTAWQWRKYGGSHPHNTHLHIDVKDAFQDDTAPWGIAGAFKKVKAKPAAKPAPVVEKLTQKQVSSVMHLGSEGEYVKDLQEHLKKLGYHVEPDGMFGRATDEAVRAFQKANGLKVDGWAGPRTLEEIGQAIEKKRAAPKLEAAAAVVDEVANGDKNYSTTEIGAGVTGVAGTVTAVKVVTDQVKESADTFTSLLTSVGPWVVLGLVIAGGAAYIYWQRRRARITATAVAKNLSP